MLDLLEMQCSGKRPSCHRCIQKGLHCIYTTQHGETPSQALKRRHHGMRDRMAVHEELFEL
jgi:adenine-specific DNA glycosylase